MAVTDLNAVRASGGRPVALETVEDERDDRAAADGVALVTNAQNNVVDFLEALARKGGDAA